MKRLAVFSIMFCLMISGIYADDTGASTWKQGVASTTYGVALLPINVSYINENGISFEDTIFLPGLDIRLFTGKNVAKRGGFFTGIETGALMFFLPPDDQLSGVDDIKVSSDLFIGTVFMLAKYGYRMDLGFKLFGLSLGWEMGIGARIASGYYELSGVRDETGGTIETGYEASYMSMMLDSAVEGAIRLGPNFRFVAKLGAMLTPPLLEMNDETGEYEGETPSYDFMDYIDLESEPYIITGRVGFIMNY